MTLILKRKRTFFFNFLLWILFTILFAFFHFEKFDSLYSFIIFIIGIIFFQIQFFFLNFKTKNYLQLFLFYFYIICLLKFNISITYSIAFLLISIIYFLFIINSEIFKHKYFNLGIITFFANYFFFPSVVFTILSPIYALFYSYKNFFYRLLQLLFGFTFGFITFWQINFLLELDSNYLYFFSNKTLAIHNYNQDFFYLIPSFLILIISIWNLLNKFNNLKFIQKKEQIILLLFITFIFISTLFFKEVEYIILYLIFPSSLIIGNFLNYEKKSNFFEMIFLTLIVSVIYYSNLVKF